MFKFIIFIFFCIRNLPQLFCQVALSMAISNLTEPVIFAFVTSFLSVLSTILRCFIDKSGEGLQYAQYYVVTEMQAKKNQIKELRVSALSDQQTKDICEKRGETQYLAKAMARIFETNDQSMEVGASIITNCGISTHIVHGIDSSELQILDPMEYISNKLIVKKQSIADLFAKHFEFDAESFSCKFYADAQRKHEIGSIDVASLQVGTRQFLNQYNLHSQSTLDSIVEILKSAMKNKVDDLQLDGTKVPEAEMMNLLNELEFETSNQQRAKNAMGLMQHDEEKGKI